MWLEGSVRLHCRELFFLCEWLSVEASFWTWGVGLCPLLFSVLRAHLAWTCAGLCVLPQCLGVHVCVSLVVSRGLVSLCPPPHWSLIIFLPPLEHRSLRPEGSGSMKTSHSGLDVPGSHSQHTVQLWVSVLVPLLWDFSDDGSRACNSLYRATNSLGNNPSFLGFSIGGHFWPITRLDVTHPRLHLVVRDV